MKKLLLILFTILKLSIVSAQDFTVNGINYSVLDGTKNVEVGLNPDATGALVIPSTVTYNNLNYSVTTIGFGAFWGNTSLTSITIPNSVTSISDNAFIYCNFTSIIIPNTVTSIGVGAFNHCSSLISITLPNTITSIKGATFGNCTSLTSITIPNSVTSIGNSAFMNCTGLTSVTIPNSVTSIGNSAFMDCTGLTSVTIPNSVTSIEGSAFSGCVRLTSLAIPNFITSINDYTFENCSSLVSVTIPNSVTSIGNYAFSLCNLNSIFIPNSVISIGEFAFINCRNLTSLTIPNSVISIGKYAFANNYLLNSIYCYTINPIVITQDVFFGVSQSQCSLTVPPQSLSLYQNALVWKDFNPINGVFLNTNNFIIKDNLKLYPNPTKNELFIDAKNLTNTKLDVLDINGKILFNQALNSTNTIDTSKLSNDMYLFKITSDEGSIIEKIIKN